MLIHGDFLRHVRIHSFRLAEVCRHDISLVEGKDFQIKLGIVCSLFDWSAVLSGFWYTWSSPILFSTKDQDQTHMTQRALGTIPLVIVDQCYLDMIS